MKFDRRSFVAAFFALGTALTVTSPSFAQTAGKDYTPIPRRNNFDLRRH